MSLIFKVHLWWIVCLYIWLTFLFLITHEKKWNRWIHNINFEKFFQLGCIHTKTLSTDIKNNLVKNVIRPYRILKLSNNKVIYRSIADIWHRLMVFVLPAASSNSAFNAQHIPMCMLTNAAGQPIIRSYGDNGRPRVTIFPSIALAYDALLQIIQTTGIGHENIRLYVFPLSKALVYMNTPNSYGMFELVPDQQQVKIAEAYLGYKWNQRGQSLPVFYSDEVTYKFGGETRVACFFNFYDLKKILDRKSTNLNTNLNKSFIQWIKEISILVGAYRSFNSEVKVMDLMEAINDRYYLIPSEENWQFLKEIRYIGYATPKFHIVP